MYIQELLKNVQENEKKLRTKEGFKGVSFIDGCITLNGGYDIELSRVKTKCDLLRWIAQISCKAWATKDHIHYFIRIVSDENGIDPYEITESELEAEVTQLREVVKQLKALIKYLEEGKK